MNNYILVLGSAPKSKLPNFEVDKIYAANGASQNADKYFRKFGRKKLISVCGSKEFYMNNDVRKRVLKSKPDIVKFRSGIMPYKFAKENLKKIKYQSFSMIESLCFQSKFLENSFISLFLSELDYQPNFTKKISHIFQIIKEKKMFGISTGLFSVLLARYENPHKNLILSGISIKTNSGNKFYGAKGQPNRMFVDKSAFIKIKKRFTKNLYTTDETTAKFCKIPLIKKKF